MNIEDPKEDRIKFNVGDFVDESESQEGQINQLNSNDKQNNDKRNDDEKVKESKTKSKFSARLKNKRMLQAVSVSILLSSLTLTFIIFF